MIYLVVLYLLLFWMESVVKEVPLLLHKNKTLLSWHLPEMVGRQKKKNKNKHLFIVEFRKKWKKKLWKEWNEQKLLFKFIFFLFYTIFSVFQRVVFMFKCMYVCVSVCVCMFFSINILVLHWCRYVHEIHLYLLYAVCWCLSICSCCCYLMTTTTTMMMMRWCRGKSLSWWAWKKNIIIVFLLLLKRNNAQAAYCFAVVHLLFTWMLLITWVC